MAIDRQFQTVDRYKVQFVRECLVQSMRLWIDDPAQVRALVPKIEAAWREMTELGYGDTFRAQINESIRQQQAAEAAPPLSPVDPRLLERRNLALDLRHWEEQAALKPGDERIAQIIRQARAKLDAFDRGEPL